MTCRNLGYCNTTVFIVHTGVAYITSHSNIPLSGSTSYINYVHTLKNRMGLLQHVQRITLGNYLSNTCPGKITPYRILR